MSEVQTFGIKFGTVSSVNVVKRTAKVIFSDCGDIVSGDLRVMDTRPTVVVEKWVEEQGEVNKWTYNAAYHCADRKFGLGETYEQGDLASIRNYKDGTYETYFTSKPDVIINEKTIKHEKNETISGNSPMSCSGGHEGGTCSIPSCPLTGITDYKYYKEQITVEPWLPYIGQFVLCAFLENGDGDGFVLGGF
ncbi:hypothetical protein FACS18949_13540 [Clostridia bacterium]|nr:hypothetical protein FACS189425_06290 [Clostridia bacterium]GHV35477.1 hypothetical protein FACS18949_13540 [Clostridia bacterium]